MNKRMLHRTHILLAITSSLLGLMRNIRELLDSSHFSNKIHQNSWNILLDFWSLKLTGEIIMLLMIFKIKDNVDLVGHSLELVLLKVLMLLQMENLFRASIGLTVLPSAIVVMEVLTS